MDTEGFELGDFPTNTGRPGVCRQRESCNRSIYRTLKFAFDNTRQPHYLVMRWVSGGNAEHGSGDSGERRWVGWHCASRIRWSFGWDEICDPPIFRPVLVLQILPKYIQRIQETARNLDTHVFRGQSDATWALRSGATRRLSAEGTTDDTPFFIDEYLDYHRVLLDRARRVMPYGDKDQSSTPLQLLAKVQHFGAATGLLDFTHSPLVALWFACDEPSHDGKVFFLSKELPHTTYVTPELEERDIGKVLSRVHDPTGPGYLLWEPMVEGDAALRILGQRSVFVIGRPAIDGRHVHAVVIDAADKEALREELEQLDVSERTIYRDLVAFCRLEGADARYVPPTTAAAYLRRGNSAFSRGTHSEAIDAYGRCLELGGDQAETYFLRGNANAAAKRYRDAIDDYDEALQSPDLTEVKGSSTHYPWFYYAILFNRGNMRACLGEHENAVEDYLRSSDVAPAFTEAHFNRGNAHFMRQQFEEAVSCYDEVLAVAPESTFALHNKALALVLLGKFDAAEACYTRIHRVAELVPNTLAPLRELKGILAGLTDSRLRIEATSSGNSAKITHPNYTGGRRAVVFTGIHGNVGNVGGGRNLPSGEGSQGGPGVLVFVEPS